MEPYIAIVVATDTPATARRGNGQTTSNQTNIINKQKKKGTKKWVKSVKESSMDSKVKWAPW